MREKLNKLMCEALETDECVGHCNHPPCWKVKLAVDSLIANGVEIPVRCKDCKSQSECKFAQYQGNDGFCSYGERRSE